MEKIIPANDGLVVLLVMTTGMTLICELPPRSDTLQRFNDGIMLGEETFLTRRPLGIKTTPKSPTEVAVHLVPLTPFENKDRNAATPFLRSQVLMMYEPKEEKLRKDYFRAFSGLDIVSSLGPVIGGALK